MEAPSGSGSSSSTWWSSATNWTISNGSSLDSIINFYSSSSSNSRIDCSTVDSSAKSPLILKPPTPDSDSDFDSDSESFPCEIKISFSKKHEIKQVYVRSTARVYEIYYAPALENTREYLCTVRGSTAIREEETNAIDVEEGNNAHSKGYNGDLTEEGVTGESDIDVDEDDWVEVNFPDSPTHDNRNSSLTTTTSVNTSNIKDFYEAMAEITDAEPCMSLTLRFRKIQSEGCVYINEVNVLADPIGSKDSSNQSIQAENSAESSIIAMLFPIFMQLSKPNTFCSQNKHTSNRIEKRQNFEITEPANVQIPLPVSNREGKTDCGAQNDFPHSQFQRFMEQIMTKVSGIEDLFLRFEENMLKPINSIEARLQRIEQQLEVLSKNSMASGFPFCATFSAPLEFSEGENCNDQLSKDTHHLIFPTSESTSDESWNNKPLTYTHSPQILDDAPFEEKSEGVDKHDPLYEGQCSSPSATIICPSAQAKHGLRNKDYEITVETSEQEAKEGDTSNYIPGYSYDSLVDFYLTLEPKFDSSPECSPKSPVGLSTKAEEIDSNACFVGSKSDASGVEDGEQMITLTKFHRMVDSDGCDVEVSSDMVCGGLQDNLTCFNQELFESPTEAVCSG